MLENCVRADAFAEVISAQIRHAHVGEDEIGQQLAGAGQRVVAVVDGRERHVLAREGHAYGFLNGDGVVGEEQ